MKNFVYLRSLVVVCLILFNVRRGEEVLWMLFFEWEEVEKGIWFLGYFKFVYLKGKGKKYVFVLILNDLMLVI